MRYVWMFLGAIAALVVIVVIIGYALPVKHRATAEATYKASPEALFALITNVEGFTAWRGGLTSAEVMPSADGRKRFREVSSDGTISYLVEAVEPNRRLVTRIDDKTLPFGGTWTYELLPAADGRTTLRITEDGEVYNPLFRFVSRFIMGHDGTIRKYLASVATRYPG
jgi:uncharacterized protein YndB with AHSA1/START domain